MPCGNGSCLISVSTECQHHQIRCIILHSQRNHCSAVFIKGKWLYWEVPLCDCCLNAPLKCHLQDNTSLRHHQSENLFSNPSLHASFTIPTSNTYVHLNIHILYLSSNDTCRTIFALAQSQLSLIAFHTPSHLPLTHKMTCSVIIFVRHCKLSKLVFTDLTSKPKC